MVGGWAGTLAHVYTHAPPTLAPHTTCYPTARTNHSPLISSVARLAHLQRTAVEHAAGGGHISKGRPECLKLLIAAGADVNLQAGTPASQAGRKFSALMQAARYGNVECVELLIAAGADLNVYAYGGTALTYAKQEPRFSEPTQAEKDECVALLEAAGARDGL
mmetsp:Transcript_34868/g.93189  ORF Transcript_34868/g.93189 Transcript_34868/m.93189 type:complete len:163 (+) Transcript_34868:2063-2551(+)